MCKEECVKKEEHITHYDFLKEVGSYWLNPELIGKEQGEGHKKRRLPFSPSLSTLTTEPTSGTRSTRRAKTAGNTRRTYITDASLFPNGGMQGRLFDATKHLPVDCDHFTIDSEGVVKRKQP